MPDIVRVRRRLIVKGLAVAAAGLVLPRAARAVPWAQASPMRSIGLWSLSNLGAALKAHWNAADHGTALMTDDGAGRISMWQDSVLGMQLIAAGSARPTWSATGFNGAYPGVQFDAIANVLRAANTTGLPSGSTDFSIWVVVHSITPGAAQQIFTYGGTTNGAIAQIQNATTGRINASNGTTVATALTQTAGNHVFGGIFGASTISGQVDGTIGGTTAYTLATGTTRTSMGANNNTTPSNLWGGTINCLLVISPVQSNVVQAKIAGYIARQAGIQSVLTNSYKNAPP